ncbi:MAG: Glycosyl transferase, WecB/TagA/CpsF family [Candidatus Moranbacteria bacterium GW2011_GWF1_36_4]|nr:MAG: Glycosyl transferase, WecB/TagA/CpsF family [Candidatus Moranbacteria bacterium GW2011_GWF1_36_4]
MEILGIKIDNFSREEILKKVEDFLNEEKFHQIATINPEFVLEAQKNKKFRNILTNCDLRVADGVGIFFALLRFGKWLKCRLTGVELMEDILQIAERKNLNIFLASWTGSLSSWKETRDAILKKYPKLKIDGDNIDCKNTFYVLRLTSDIIFCNFGAPNQEIFLDSLKHQNNAKIRLAMGVGGSFDYLTKKTPRAPKFAQILGLEWLWRLILEPKYRFKRVLSAVLVFPIKILLDHKKIIINK